MSKIDPLVIVEETGVGVDDVEAVLGVLTPNWLFDEYSEWRDECSGRRVDRCLGRR